MYDEHLALTFESEIFIRLEIVEYVNTEYWPKVFGKCNIWSDRLSNDAVKTGLAFCFPFPWCI